MTRDRGTLGRRHFALLLGLFLHIAGVPIVHAQGDSSPNILVIIGDDMGIETLASFGVGTDTPKTAALDALAERGVSFTNMWRDA